MIISVAELKTYISTTVSDSVLEGKLQALELLIRKYTNNNFQIRKIRDYADTSSDDKTITLYMGNIPLQVNDTIQISNSEYMPNMLCTIDSITGNAIVVNENIFDENEVMITKISYPQDVKMGVVDLMKWELDNRSKVGIQSETISRHSVTYFNMDGDNSIMGYPKSLMGFLRPYKKARF